MKVVLGEYCMTSPQRERLSDRKKERQIGRNRDRGGGEEEKDVSQRKKKKKGNNTGYFVEEVKRYHGEFVTVFCLALTI